MLCLLTPAFGARPVTGSQGSNFVEEEWFGVTVAPNVAMPILKLELAADPLPRRPTPRCQVPVIVMDSSAAIAHEQPTRRNGGQFAKWVDAVL